MEMMAFIVLCVIRNRAMTAPGFHNLFNIPNRIETQKLLVTESKHKHFLSDAFSKLFFLKKKLLDNSFISQVLLKNSIYRLYRIFIPYYMKASILDTVAVQLKFRLVLKSAIRELFS